MKSGWYEINHLKSVSEKPICERPSVRMVSEMVSKAALRSRRMRTERSPESAAVRRSLKILVRAFLCCKVGRSRMKIKVP